MQKMKSWRTIFNICFNAMDIFCKVYPYLSLSLPINPSSSVSTHIMQGAKQTKLI